MPTPRNKADLLRMIGLMNYLSPFCQNLSSLIQPLRALTKDGVEFIWSKLQDDSFQQAKNLVSSTLILMYYDLQKPVVLQVDASEEDLGVLYFNRTRTTNFSLLHLHLAAYQILK